MNLEVNLWLQELLEKTAVDMVREKHGYRAYELRDRPNQYQGFEFYASDGRQYREIQPQMTLELPLVLVWERLLLDSKKHPDTFSEDKDEGKDDK